MRSKCWELVVRVVESFWNVTGVTSISCSLVPTVDTAQENREGIVAGQHIAKKKKIALFKKGNVFLREFYV